MALTDTLHIPDSGATLDTALAADSIAAADTIPVGERNEGVVFVGHTEGIPQPPRTDSGMAGSWLLLGVTALIALLCSRFGSNYKFLKSLLRNLTSVRKRENLFDDTARETSFMVLLNLLCAVTVGLLIFVGAADAGLIHSDADDFTRDVWTCILSVGVYCFVMPPAYYIAGHTFSDTEHTRLWMRGFLASQAILGLLLLIPSLAALFYTAAASAIVIAAVIIFLIVKILFIAKSFRIFFLHFSSWVLFLYYLCILEILPLIATWKCILHFAQ